MIKIDFANITNDDSRLITHRPFLGLFWTQFLGAFNDNVFKNGLVILVAYKTLSEENAGFLVNLAAGLFTLPFVLFSAIAGQLTDVFSKTIVIRWVKVAEIVIMALASVGFYYHNLNLLFVCLFLMGTHSAFFGPAKYSIIPEVTPRKHLIEATAMIEMGTFLGVLLGTLLGGFLIIQGPLYLAAGVMILSILGLQTSQRIPVMPSANSTGKIDFNPFSQYAKIAKISYQEHSLFWSMMAISWFWLCGSILLAQLPTLIKFTMNANESVVTLFLSIFTLSLALGSLVANKMSKGKVELGLVGLGGILMGIGAIDLGLIPFRSFEEHSVQMTLLNFFTSDQMVSKIRALLDIVLMGVAGSLYIMPLYALLQIRSEKRTISQVIAMNNLLNAIFMASAAGVVMILFENGWHAKQLFVLVGILNIFAMGFFFLIMPELATRFYFFIQQLLGLGDQIRRESLKKWESSIQIPKTADAIVVLISKKAISRHDFFEIAHLLELTPRFGFGARARDHIELITMINESDKKYRRKLYVYTSQELEHESAFSGTRKPTVVLDFPLE